MLIDCEPVGSAYPLAVESRIEQREQRAYERGRRDAEKVLREQLIQQRSEVQQLQIGTLQSLARTTPRLAEECERALVELAFSTACRLVHGTPITSELIEASIREALAELKDNSRVCVLLHPADLALMKKLNGGSQLEDAAPGITFRQSEEVTRGGCILETPFGVIDARRETKLERAREMLQL